MAVTPPFQELLHNAAQAAISAANPAKILPQHLPELPSTGRLIVLGAGKASAAMASAVEDHYVEIAGPSVLDRVTGIVLTRYDHAVATRKIEIIEAAHPVPDQAGRDGTQRLLALAKNAEAGDLVLFLASGGGSALLTAPAPGVSFEEKQRVNSALLKSGADIGSMNTVRKHLSAVKGGRLAKIVAPARLLTLAISDVPGDAPEVIASGPTVPDTTTLAQARDVISHYEIQVPSSVQKALNDPANETPKPGDAIFDRAETLVVAKPQASLEAAAAVFRDAGVTPIILGDALEGESREVGIVMAGIARQVARHGQPSKPPVALLSGGETTVTVRQKGRGGRNTEFLLGCALDLDGYPGVHGIAVDTDGIDGSESNAGAYFSPETLARARENGTDPAASLMKNDAYGVFLSAESLVVTGPTLTNVNDFRAILITDEEEE